MVKKIQMFWKFYTLYLNFISKMSLNLFIILFQDQTRPGTKIDLSKMYNFRILLQIRCEDEKRFQYDSNAGILKESL
jgi:hypothetical protein